MRLALLLAAALFPTTALAQPSPRLELAAGFATPLLDDATFDGSGYAVRVTARPSRLGAAFAFRADLAYASLGFSRLSSTSGAGDLTAVTFGTEWRGGNQVSRSLQAYGAFGIGIATGYYGDAGGGDDGRATGGAAMISLGARRAIRRSTIALEVGVAAYGPLRRTTVVPVTVAWGF